MSRSKQCFTARGLTSHLLLLVGSIFCKVSLADTETLWELVDPGQYLGDLAGISLPEQVDTQRAVYLSGSLFDGLLANDTLTVEIADQQAFNYVIEQRSDYLNGDSGWRAGFSNQDQSFGISLTYNSQVILATIFSPTGKYSLQAIPLQNSDDYIGWVYSFAREAQYLPIDDGAYISSGSPGSNALMDFVALSGNDVSVVQTLTSSGGDSGTQINATIGDILTVSIRITNNLSSTLINEEVNILFILDETDFISSSTGCEAGSTGVQPSVQCTIDGLAPGTSTTLDYTVQLTDVSYPQVASGVFVGDLSGEYVQQNAFV
ncbi:MAG: hypothetical protein QGG54_11950, partial [Gammaproteobacteria bacterium]|nr:hypothetical protein [Gammaproteobacteria bacterium]